MRETVDEYFNDFTLIIIFNNLIKFNANAFKFECFPKEDVQFKIINRIIMNFAGLIDEKIGLLSNDRLEHLSLQN